VLVYSTLNHLKYCLPNGDSGILRTLDVPLYVTRVAGGVVHALDRDGKARALQVDMSEAGFKLALLQKRFDAVIAMIRAGRLCGQAIIAYLQQKGYPEVALHFVTDERLRFSLALQCGNIEVALQSAQALDDRDTWYRLGVEALRQGNHQIVEHSYQRTKSYERLSFLYLITGDVDKLRKMLKLAEVRGDAMSRFHNALYLGDVREQVRVLEESGQAALAYVAAAAHGLADDAARIGAGLEELPPVPAGARLLRPPAPLLREDNWPLLTVSKGMFETLAARRDAPGAGGASAAAASAGAALDASELEQAGWGDEDELDLGGGGGGRAGGSDGGGGDGGDGDAGSEGWEMEDLDLPPDVPAASSAAAASAGPSAPFVVPPPGQPAAQRWLEKRTQLAAAALIYYLLCFGWL
jgi:coatomer protein complex subunit alpha (xenin)